MKNYLLKLIFFVKHPFLKNIPVFFTNYILIDYGTGAIFGCPAHDKRDFEFAKKNNLDIISVIENHKNELLIVKLIQVLK